MDKETYGLVQGKKDFELVSKNAANSNYEIGAPVTAKEKPKASKLQDCFVGVATITALLALAVAVAAIVLIVFFPSLTSNVDEQVQKQAAEIGNLKEMLNRSQTELAQLRDTVTNDVNELENAFNEELGKIRNNLSHIETFVNPVSSCSDIPQDSPSGHYWIQTRTSSPVLVYCDMNRIC